MIGFLSKKEDGSRLRKKDKRSWGKGQQNGEQDKRECAASLRKQWNSRLLRDTSEECVCRPHLASASFLTNQVCRAIAAPQ